MALTQVNAQMISGALTTNSSGQISIGSTTLNSNLSVYGSGSGTFGAYNDPLVVQGSSYTLQYLKGTNGVAASIYSYNTSNGWYTGTNNSAAYRIGYMSSVDQTGVSNAKDGSSGITVDTNGFVYINQSGQLAGLIERAVITSTSNTNTTLALKAYAENVALATTNTSTNPYYGALFCNNGDFGSSTKGSIVVSNSSVAYNTTSDYRLKENVAPMVGALVKVAQLKPVTYTWKEDGSDGEGFIAHELAEVCPLAVTGEKDAVETYLDNDGNEQTKIKPQSIDTSFLVATLTAAIQELNAKVTALETQLAAK